MTQKGGLVCSGDVPEEAASVSNPQAKRLHAHATGNAPEAQIDQASMRITKDSLPHHKVWNYTKAPAERTLKCYKTCYTCPSPRCSFEFLQYFTRYKLSTPSWDMCSMFCNTRESNTSPADLIPQLHSSQGV